MSRKSRWWGRRSTDGADPETGDEQQHEGDAEHDEVTDEEAEQIVVADGSTNGDARVAQRSEPKAPPTTARGNPEEDDDPDMSDEERQARARSRRLESEAEEARLARVRALEEITSLRQSEREALERAMQEEVEADRAAQERIAAERSAAELAEAEAAATERAAEERAAAEAAARRRVEAEKLVRQHAEAEQKALDSAAEELSNAERAAEQRQQAETKASDTGRREREISERASELRGRAEEAIDRRRAAEKTVEELLAKERASRARLAAERAAAARAAAERSLAAQRALEKAQAELAAAEREAAERAQAAKSIAERLARAQAQAERAQSALGSAEDTLAELGDDLDDEDPSLDDLGELDDELGASAAADDEEQLGAPTENGKAPDRRQPSDDPAQAADVEGGAAAPARSADTSPAPAAARQEPRRPATSRGVAALRRGAQPLLPLLLIAVGATALAFRPDPSDLALSSVTPGTSPAPIEPQDAGATAIGAGMLALSQPLLERQRRAPVPDPAEVTPTPAWLRNSVVVGPRDDRPMIAVVIDDMGVEEELSARTVELPAPLTLAYLPYAPRVDAQASRAKAAGHELLIHVPMEPNSRFEDPGPNALDVELEADEIERRLAWAFDRVPGVVGINNHMGSRFTRDPVRMQRVLDRVSERQLMFLDSMTSPESVGWRLAAAASIPYSARDVFIDHLSDPAHIRAQLAELESVARRNGVAIGIGHPRPATLAALRTWLPSASARGIRFVPVTAVMREQRSL